MSLETEFLLNKAIATPKGMSELDKRNVSELDFTDEVDKKVYLFLKNYASRFDGDMPDPEIVASEIPDFEFHNEISTSFDHLTNKVKADNLAMQVYKFMTGTELSKAWEDMGQTNPSAFLKWHDEQITNIRKNAHANIGDSKNLAESGEWFVEEYLKRKEGKSTKLWKSSFPSINRSIGGGYMSGNMYGWFAESGRGKSIITMTEMLEAAYQGANVLFWVLEMSKYEFVSRLISFISAKEEMVSSLMADGQNYLAGFKVSDMLTGKISQKKNEDKFFEFMANLNNTIAGNIYYRCADDKDFLERNVAELERNIQENAIDVVLVDPIYLMQYERNTSRTTGGDAAATSVALRNMALRTSVVLHVITQAVSSKSNAEERELELPSRDDVKKTSAILEDSANLFSFDSCDGNFRVGVLKGRVGGEGDILEGIFLPMIGWVREHDRNSMQSLVQIDF